MGRDDPQKYMNNDMRRGTMCTVCCFVIGNLYSRIDYYHVNIL